MSDFDNSDETFFQVQEYNRTTGNWRVWSNFRTLTAAKNSIEFKPSYSRFRIVQAIIVHRANYD